MTDAFSKNITLFFIFTAFSLTILLLDHFFLLGWFRGGAEKIINPAKLWINQGKQGIFPGYDTGGDPVILQAKIDFFQTQNASLQIQINDLLQENEVLKNQLHSPSKSTASLLPAKNLSVVGGIMTLDKGVNEGVKEGMIVVSEGILVGRVIVVTPYASRVQLPIKEDSNIKVEVVSLKEKGVLKGTPENRLILDEVLQKTDLQEEQVVATTGEEGIYPADLPVGKIDKVIKDDVAIYKKAEVKPLLDYRNLKVVMIRV